MQIDMITNKWMDKTDRHTGIKQTELISKWIIYIATSLERMDTQWGHELEGGGRKGKSVEIVCSSDVSLSNDERLGYTDGSNENYTKLSAQWHKLNPFSHFVLITCNSWLQHAAMPNAGDAHSRNWNQKLVPVVWYQKLARVSVNPVPVFFRYQFLARKRTQLYSSTETACAARAHEPCNVIGRRVVFCKKLRWTCVKLFMQVSSNSFWCVCHRH